MRPLTSIALFLCIIVAHTQVPNCVFPTGFNNFCAGVTNGTDLRLNSTVCACNQICGVIPGTFNIAVNCFVCFGNDNSQQSNF